jgi:hypothetical protein
VPIALFIPHPIRVSRQQMMVAVNEFVSSTENLGLDEIRVPFPA